MKKIALSLSLTLSLASVALAQITVWSEDYSFVLFDGGGGDFGVLYDSEKTANTPAMISGGTDEWSEINGNLNLDVAGSGKSGFFVEQTSGASRAVSFVLDDTIFTLGAGQYTFNYEVWTMYNPTTLRVDVFEAQASPGNDYFVDLAGPGGSIIDVAPAAGSTASVSLLATDTHVRTDGDMTHLAWSPVALDFNYSGAGDVVLLLSGYRTVATTGQVGFTIGGDMSITAVPEPGVFALFLGIGALGFILVRRRR